MPDEILTSVSVCEQVCPRAGRANLAAGTLLPLVRHAVGPGAGETAARVPDGHGHRSGDEAPVSGIPSNCHGFDGRSDRELLVLAALVGLDLAVVFRPHGRAQVLAAVARRF